MTAPAMGQLTNPRSFRRRTTALRSLPVRRAASCRVSRGSTTTASSSGVHAFSPRRRCLRTCAAWCVRPNFSAISAVTLGLSRSTASSAGVQSLDGANDLPFLRMPVKTTPKALRLLSTAPRLFPTAAATSPAVFVTSSKRAVSAAGHSGRYFPVPSARRCLWTVCSEHPTRAATSVEVRLLLYRRASSSGVHWRRLLVSIPSFRRCAQTVVTPRPTSSAACCSVFDASRRTSISAGVGTHAYRAPPTLPLRFKPATVSRRSCSAKVQPSFGSCGASAFRARGVLPLRTHDHDHSNAPTITMRVMGSFVSISLPPSSSALPSLSPSVRRGSSARGLRSGSGRRRCGPTRGCRATTSGRGPRAGRRRPSSWSGSSSASGRTSGRR